MEKYRIILKGIVQYEDRYLVVEKWYDDRILDPYQWEFIDGVLEFGEIPDKGVIRLVEEKTGLVTSVDEILYTWGFTTGEVCNVGIAYLLVAESEEVVLSEELRDSRWVEKSELSNIITNEAVREDIDRAGLTRDFELGDFGKVDTFIEPLD